MSKEASWTQETPESVLRSFLEAEPVTELSYDSVEQVVMAFKEVMLTSTIHYESEQYLGRLWPWYLKLAFTDMPDAALPFVKSALTRFFNGKDETGGVIFPVDRIEFANKWIVVFGDITRVNEITPWPWTASNYAAH